MGIDGMINQLKSIDIDKMIFRILSNSNLQYNLIGDIQKRIFEKGITATGKVLRTDFARSNSKRLKGKQGFYSKNTEIIKRAKSQPVNRVTLSDTGQFFNSFSIKHSKNFITISAETRKKNGRIEDNFKDSFATNAEFSNEILNLNTDEQQTLIEVMKQEMLNEFKRILM